MFEWKIWLTIAKISVALLCVTIILIASSKDANNWSAQNKKIIKRLSISILSIAIIFSVLQLVCGSQFKAYATGMYSSWDQVALEDQKVWEVTCKKAFTSGQFKYSIGPRSVENNKLIVESRCRLGTLTLRIQQDGKIENIDITNTSGSIEYDLSEFLENSDLKLSVQHTKAEDISFKISW